MNSTTAEKMATSHESERRSFFARAAAIVAGAIAVVFPVAAGSGVLFHPLRRHKEGVPGTPSHEADYLRICPLDALATDGRPQRFVVTADVTDAWTRTIAQRIGSIYLSRQDSGGTPKVTAFNATCPHLGCAVEFDAAEDHFECPCHVSGFSKDGRKLFGPSLRGLDELKVKLAEKNGTQEVWVAFEHFRAGVAERIPVG